MSAKPLTDEQLWGLPDKDRPESPQESPQESPEQKPDWCPYKERRCQFWDQGCQADMCIFNEGEK